MSQEILSVKSHIGPFMMILGLLASEQSGEQAKIEQTICKAIHLSYRDKVEKNSGFVAKGSIDGNIYNIYKKEDVFIFPWNFDTFFFPSKFNSLHEK